MKTKALFGLLKETFQEWSDDKAPRLAAALSRGFPLRLETST